MTASREGPAYHRLKQRFRVALDVARGLCDRDRRVARLMLEFVNFAVFQNSGAVVCWVGVETLALCLREDAQRPADRTRIQRAHRALRKAGVLEVQTPGGGRGRTTVHAFSQSWLERVTAEVEARGPAPLRALMRPFPAERAALSGAAFSGTSAAVSAAYEEDFDPMGDTGAALFDQGAALSPANGGTGAALSIEGAALSTPFGGTAAAVSGESAALFGRNGGTGAALSSQGAALSDAVGGLGAADPAGPVGNGVTGAALSGVSSGGFARNGGTGDSKTAAPVQPETIESKPVNQARPIQRSLMLPITGGKAVGAAVAEERERSRALQAVESDGRFEKLRQTAAKMLGGDVRVANLAISVLDERVKRRILRGDWPEPVALQGLLREALDKVGAQMGRSVGRPQTAAPPPPIEGEGARLDRVERMAAETAAEVRQLSGAMAEFMALIRTVIPAGGTAAA